MMPSMKNINFKAVKVIDVFTYQKLCVVNHSDDYKQFELKLLKFKSS